MGVSGTLLGRSGGVCGLSGRLRGAPGGTLETFWDLLGSSGSTFWEQFWSEKQFSAISDWKTYAKRVSTSRSIQSVLFQTAFEKNPVAKTSKELVCFFCRSARFAVLQLLFSGSAEVAAGLSNFGEDRCGPRESDGGRISMHRSERSWHLGHFNSLRVFPGLPGDT